MSLIDELFKLVYATAALWVCTHYGLVSAVKQQITLYESPQNSSALNESVSTFALGDSTRNVSAALLASNSKLQNLTGACTNGMWMVYSEPYYATPSNSTFGILSALIPNNTKPPACLSANGTAKPIQSARHVGHTDISVSALSLYDSNSMATGRELYFEGVRLVLPSPLMIGSYGFTGARHWRLSPELISDTNEGGSVCLELPKHNDTQLNATQGSVITYKEAVQGVAWSVREIQAGCTGREGSISFPDYDVTPFEVAANGNTPEPWDGMEWWRQGQGATTVTNSSNGSNHTGLIVEEVPIIMNSPGLRLVVRTKANTTQTGDLIVVGSKLRLIEPLLVINYTFTGSPPRNWTVYSDVDGTTGVKCLVYGTTVGAGAGLANATATPEPITIGAITIGCDGDANAGGGETSAAGRVSQSAPVHQFISALTLLLIVAVF